MSAPIFHCFCFSQEKLGFGTRIVQPQVLTISCHKYGSTFSLPINPYDPLIFKLEMILFSVNEEKKLSLCTFQASAAEGKNPHFLSGANLLLPSDLPVTSNKYFSSKE